MTDIEMTRAPLPPSRHGGAPSTHERLSSCLLRYGAGLVILVAGEAALHFAVREVVGESPNEVWVLDLQSVCARTVLCLYVVAVAFKLLRIELSPRPGRLGELLRSERLPRFDTELVLRVGLWSCALTLLVLTAAYFSYALSGSTEWLGDTVWWVGTLAFNAICLLSAVALVPALTRTARAHRAHRAAHGARVQEKPEEERRRIFGGAKKPAELAPDIETRESFFVEASRVLDSPGHRPATILVVESGLPDEAQLDERGYLARFERLLADSFRETDLIANLGFRKYGVLLSDATEEHTREPIERLRENLAELFELEDRHPRIGIAPGRGRMQTAKTLYRTALRDMRLLQVLSTVAR